MDTIVLMWRPGNNLRALVLSLQNLGSNGQTQVASLDGTHHHPVSHLTGLND